MKESSIMYFDMIYHNGGFLTFGGSSGHDESTIARFDQSTKNWSKLGDLVTARSGAGVVYDGHSFLVVGGNDEKSTEECKMEGMSITCTSRSPKLNEFYRWPTFIPFYDNSDQ